MVTRAAVANSGLKFRPDQREVRPERGLQKKAPAAELPLLLPARQVGPDTRRRVERRQSRAAGADALDQGALGHQLEIDLARPDRVVHGSTPRRDRPVGCDDLPDLVVLGQDLRGGWPHAPDVADEGEFAAALRPQRLEQARGPALYDPESAHQNCGAVGDVGHRGGSV
jgi:hypothetical protein